MSCSKLTSSQRQAIPIEQKESHRWLTTLERAQRIASDIPGTRFVCVADSEADIYELIAEAMAEPSQADWIVRACQDRALKAQGDGGRGQQACNGEASPRSCASGSWRRRCCSSR